MLVSVGATLLGPCDPSANNMRIKAAVINKQNMRPQFNMELCFVVQCAQCHVRSSETTTVNNRPSSSHLGH